jgi:molybdate transport system regulatory protein
MEALPEFEVSLRRDGVTLGGRDMALLRAIDEHGSLNRAASALGRSYSRAQQRIVELEEGFGDLVERQRGGAEGGGSRLTPRARQLERRYERLRLEFSGVADTAETVLTGRVVDRDGRLATVESAAGTVRGLVPTDVEDVRLIVRADAVTLQSPSASPPPDTTSARNRLEGTVTAVEVETSIGVVSVDVGAPADLTAIVTRSSVDRLGLEVGTPVVVSFKATATRGMPRVGPDRQ